MVLYFTFFSLISVAAIGHSVWRARLVDDGDSQHTLGFFVPIGLAIFAFVGLSYGLGCDWANYRDFFDAAAASPILNLLTGRDPGFFALNWLGYQLGGEVFGEGVVRLVIAAIFASGLIAFCRHMPRGENAIVVALPYLVIVVATGYMRQAMALGCLFWVLSIYGTNWWRIGLKTLLLALGMSFHLPFAPVGAVLLLTFKLNRWQWIMLLAAAVIVGVAVIDPAQLVHTLRYYLDKGYERSDQVSSLGAYYRVPVVVGAAAIWALMLLPLNKSWSAWQSLRVKITPAVSLLAVLALPLIVMMPFFSTVADRYAVYFSVVLLAVVGYSNYLPRFFGHIVRWGTYPIALIFLIIWLRFATYSQCWLPYQSWLPSI